MRCKGPWKVLSIRWLQKCAEVIPFLRNSDTASYRPDLVILDYRMPLNGGKALAELKHDPDYWSIPVLVLTGTKSHRDIEEIYRLGANCCYKKPFDLDSLDTLVQTMTEHWLVTVCTPTAVC